MRTYQKGEAFNVKKGYAKVHSQTHFNLIKNFMIEHYNKTFAYFLTSDYGNFITFIFSFDRASSACLKFTRVTQNFPSIFVYEQTRSNKTVSNDFFHEIFYVFFSKCVCFVPK